MLKPRITMKGLYTNRTLGSMRFVLKFGIKERMDNMQFIALFFPGFIGTYLYKEIESDMKSLIRYSFTYFIFVLWTNLTSTLTVNYILRVDGVLSEALNSFSFFMIYTIMSCFFAILGALLGKTVRRKIKWKRDKKQKESK